MTAPAVEKPGTEDDTQPEHTGGMVALIPSEPDSMRLAIGSEGEPKEDLHLTLAYLGDDVTGWPIDNARVLVEEMREIAGRCSPIEARVFAHALFNPDSHDDREPCAVYLIGDTAALAPLRAEIRGVVEHKEGVPEQHEPFIAHVTAGYGVDVGELSYTGPIVFDRLRVALADEVTDLPLGEETTVTAPAEQDEDLTAAVSAKQRKDAEEEGDTYPGTDQYPIDTRDRAKSAVRLYGNSDLPAEKVKAWLKRRLKAKGWEDLIPDAWTSDSVKASAEHDQDDEALTAAGATPAPPIDWFRDPGLDKPSPLTVDKDGRVTGHLATWDSKHIAFPNQAINPPRSRTDYAYFHTGSRAVLEGSEETLISTGHITLDTGHAEIGADHRAASAHYDDTGTLVADVCAGEDAHGIWVTGALAPGVDDLKLHKLRACGLSGDWRRIGSGLELVAALSVPTPGFPIPRSRVASGEPVALVAAGALPPPVEGTIDVDAIAEAVVARWEQRQEQKALTAALTTERDGLLDDLDDTPEIVAQLLDELDDPLSAEEITYVDSLDSPTAEDLAAIESGLTAAGKRGKNWIEQTGTGHLPRYIKRISKHLRKKGMTESHAIAVAVNAAKRMCSSGDLNFKGAQQVNPGSRAEACKAVAEWEAKKVQAKAS